MRLSKSVVMLAIVAVIFALAGCGSSVGQPSDKGRASPEQEQPETKDSAKKEASERASKKTKQLAPQKGNEEAGRAQEVKPRVPEKKLLHLTIPKMENLRGAAIPTGLGTAEALFKYNTAVHVAGTGFPWEDEANVYIAGHVAGYKGTRSYRAFAGIKKLEDGDEIFIKDANNRLYTYRVYEKKVVRPTDVEVLDPVPGKNIVTLQTCEIIRYDANGNPDYSNTDRYIVRAERVS